MVQVSKQLMDFVRPTPHSTYSPSSTSRWATCGYSIEAEKGIEEGTPHPAAVEGTLAHKICEDLFAHKYYDVERSTDLMMAKEEMFDGANMYYDCVIGWLENKEDIGEVLWFGLEKGIPIFPEHSCFGTADAVIVGTKGCVMIDYKYGKSPVGAKAEQLFAYLLGVYRHLIDIPEDYAFHAVVVQPRTDYLPKHHVYSKSEFPAFEAKIYTAILESKRPGLVPVEGRHCFWCKAKRTPDINKKCPAIAGKALEAANQTFDKFFGDMANQGKPQAPSKEVRDKALIKIMTLAPILNALAKEAKEEFEFRTSNGENIEGIRKIGTMGNRQWRLKGQEMVDELKKRYPDLDPIVVTSKLKTQAQIKKEVKKEWDESLVVRKMKETIEIKDSKSEEVLGKLVNYKLLLDSATQESV